jgi:hypothetical protein
MEAFYFVSGIACAFIFHKIVDTIHDIAVKFYLIKNKEHEQSE